MDLEGIPIDSHVKTMPDLEGEKYSLVRNFIWKGNVGYWTENLADIKEEVIINTSNQLEFRKEI